MLQSQTNYKRPIFIFLILLGFCINLFPQGRIDSHMDFGTNGVSDGLYVRAAGLWYYTSGKYSLNTGFQFDLKSKNENFLTGFNISGGRDFKLWGFNFKVDGFFKWTFFSGALRISDFGIMESVDRPHFTAAIGTHFKTFSLTEEAIWYWDPVSDTEIHDNWAFLYKVGYRIREKGADWNIGFTITNLDYFIISRDSNPSFSINGSLNLNKKVSLFGETWLKSSGAFNSDEDYFGFFLRTGLTWKIGN